MSHTVATDAAQCLHPEQVDALGHGHAHLRAQSVPTKLAVSSRPQLTCLSSRCGGGLSPNARP
jgi:hypothetical protein